MGGLKKITRQEGPLYFRPTLDVGFKLKPPSIANLSVVMSMRRDILEWKV